ncbi:Inositol 2-dehydrogenase [Planctomycetes bacterium MalM25]|nr:Inositol 2-dehydrogenase [Planctomycetes bacterium MalM25]
MSDIKPNRLSLNRRHFLAAGAATAAALPAASYARVVGANNRLTVGVVGAGGMGTGHLHAIQALGETNNLRLAAVADCWTQRATQAKERFGADLAAQDYRRLLDRDEIDYVTIATPEHRHEEVVLASLDAGKHVYCEKPLTHTIPECQRVLAKLEETGLSLQVGVQGMSDDSYASAAEAIRAGELGQVVQAQIEYVRRYGEQGPWRTNPPTDPAMPKPADLDWRAWLGDAPAIGWNPNHYFEWRNYAAYSGGISTDLFIHRITRIMKACDLMYPSRVVGMGGIWQWRDGRDLPDNFEMICEYPRGMTVYVLGTMSNRAGISHCIRGYRATLYFTGGGWEIRNKDGELLREHKKTGAEDLKLHHTNLHNHLRSEEPLNCPAELGMAGVAAVCMALESWKTGTMTAWDAENERVVSANTMPPRPSAEELQE